jgi:hypothetical protein
MKLKQANDNKLHLGHSSITDNIYLGRQKNNMWVGEKREITSEFINIMLQKFKPNTTTIITNGDKPEFKIIVVDFDKEVIINEKEIIQDIQDIIDIFRKAMANDKNLFDCYKSWIAMAFKDEYFRNKKVYKNKNDIHTIANNAAIDFLNFWIDNPIF